MSTHIHADGAYKELLWNPVGVSAVSPNEKNHGVRVLMQGSEVFKVAVKTLDRVVEETLEANNLDRHAIDWLIPHQANLRIIQATAKRLDMPMERVIVTVDKHGEHVGRLGAARARLRRCAPARCNAASCCCSKPSAAASPGARRCLRY